VRPIAGAIALVALLVSLTACGGCGGGGSAGPEVGSAAGAPVVLISIDTLRSDRLPAYGYDRVDTPALDRLRQDAVLFERAYSHYPLTLPSHSSILTGLLPPGHGVRDNAGYPLETADLPFLPRLLGEAGYATGGMVSAYVLRAATGIGDSFDTYEDGIRFRAGADLGSMQRPGGETLRSALAWLDGLEDGGEEPFFLFFHIYEPHTPWRAPEPFRSRYADRPYDAEVAAADKVIGDLLDALEERGLYDDALIVLLSDHGEGLGDHGEQEHGVLLYREAIQVPLLVKLPGGVEGGGTVSRPVGLVDVAPTVLDLVTEGGAEAAGSFDGRSLLPLIFDGDGEAAAAFDDRPVYAETIYPRLHLGWSDLASMVDGRHHYIEAPTPELYDLIDDPAETDNVLTRERRAYARLRDSLESIDRTVQAPSAEDPETREQLAALGYLGGGTLAEGDLPDPKDNIEVLERLAQAFTHNLAGEFAQAVPIFQRVLEDNPRVVDAWENLARAYEGLGRRQEALDAYGRALEESGGAPHLALSAARVHLELGELEEAEEHARLALAANPGVAHELLAQTALRRQDFDRAEREARASLDADDDRPGPRMTLGEILAGRGDLDGALAQLREEESRFADREDPELTQGLYLLLGDVLARRGESAPARAAFERAIERHPRDLRAYTSLALLHATEGRAPEAGRTLQRMVESNPGPESYAEAVRTLEVLGDPRSARGLLAQARSLYPDSELLRSLRSGS
jgi:arylsulfatase A-like enzyme/Flp pilus assembly protein TadD